MKDRGQKDKDQKVYSAFRRMRRDGLLNLKQIEAIEIKLPGFIWEPGRDLAFYVDMAERIQQEFGGRLPSSPILDKIPGAGKLRTKMRENPDAFSHIKKFDLKLVILAKNVALAERLTEENAGSLPIPNWLEKNKYHSVLASMRKYPEAYSHIKQSRKSDKLDDLVDLAESLEKEHGFLPRHTWLHKHGHHHLYNAIIAYPELFSHIKTRTELEEMVSKAEDLACTHNGLLPIPKWMRSNGYGKLQGFIYRHKDAFSHINKPAPKNTRWSSPKKKTSRNKR